MYNHVVKWTLIFCLYSVLWRKIGGNFSNVIFYAPRPWCCLRKLNVLRQKVSTIMITVSIYYDVLTLSMIFNIFKINSTVLCLIKLTQAFPRKFVVVCIFDWLHSVYLGPWVAFKFNSGLIPASPVFFNHFLNAIISLTQHPCFQ